MWLLNVIRSLCRSFDRVCGQGELTHIHANSCEKLRRLVLRPPDQQQRPLITFSNHTSTIDEPYILHSLAPDVSTSTARWIWCAHDICYKHWWYPTWFFTCLNVHPIIRGDGIYQDGMKWATRKLCGGGGWFHLFPEGRCIQGIGYSIEPLRWGIGKLIVDTFHLNPLVVPIAHYGMDTMLPLSTYIPKPARVSMIVGDPIDFSQDFAAHPHHHHHQQQQQQTYPTPQSPVYPRAEDPAELYAAVTTRAQHSLQSLMRTLQHHDEKSVRV